MVLSKKNVTILVLGAAILLVVVLKLFFHGPRVAIDSVAARGKGPLQAKVNIVEFIDFECPACARGALLLKEYFIRYPGALRLEVKYYPLMNIHHHAMQVASYGECVARQGKFWPFFEVLMSQQAAWSQLINAEGIFDQIAQSSQVDMKQLKTCLTSEDVSTSIMSEKVLGRTMGVQSTPTYFINNKMVVGAKSLTEELNHYFPDSASQK